MWKVTVSKVQGLPFVPVIPVIVLPLNAPEHMCLLCQHCQHCICGQKEGTWTKYWTFRICRILCTNCRERLWPKQFTASFVCLYVFFFLGQLYFSQCEIQAGSHLGAQFLGTMKWGSGVDSGVWVSCWSEKWMLFTIYVEWVFKKMRKVTRRLMRKKDFVDQMEE